MASKIRKETVDHNRDRQHAVRQFLWFPKSSVLNVHLAIAVVRNGSYAKFIPC